MERGGEGVGGSAYIGEDANGGSEIKWQYISSEDGCHFSIAEKMECLRVR